MENENNQATTPESVDHVVTEEDLKNNPELADAGVKVGDTVQIPKEDDAGDTGNQGQDVTTTRTT